MRNYINLPIQTITSTLSSENPATKEYKQSIKFQFTIIASFTLMIKVIDIALCKIYEAGFRFNKRSFFGLTNN